MVGLGKALIDQDALNSLLTRLESTWKDRYPDRKPPLQPSDNILHYEEASHLVSESYSPLQMKGSETKKFQQNMTDDDFTYLQLIISCIPFYVNFIGGVSILESHRTIYKLLAISKNKEVAYWPLAQECMITTMVLDVLVQIVPYMEDEFIENAGPNKILYIISRYQTSGLDQNILRKCLKTLNIIIKRSSSDSIVNSLLYNDGLNLIIVDTADNLLLFLSH
ncbi:hypothetical protein NQ318_001384 [Aromia moschata]|uniref:MutS-like protein n=1 Tax=Aromia moschata TaxID=1265417 RepID=A0AAV8YV76_9CUCU|nr:hypothetical protein NQ318_001384 [Aromia moschata]